LIRPTLALAVEFNRAVRDADEWFDEPDDFDRIEQALAAIGGIDDLIEAAAVLAYRVVRAQGFGEGNKRTAVLLTRWMLDRNGVDGARIVSADDLEFADLLVKAASGLDVETDLVTLLRSR
jgi:prophage maintenance system killer protein